MNEAQTLLTILGSANRFVEALALERSVYNQVLLSSDAAQGEKQRLVSERVAFTDRVFEETLARLSQLSPSEALPFRHPVEQARGAVAAARAQADKAWGGARETVPSDAARALVSEFVKAAAILDQVTGRLEHALAERDSRLGLMVIVSRPVQRDAGSCRAAGDDPVAIRRHWTSA